jgi:hypothetical protein
MADPVQAHLDEIIYVRIQRLTSNHPADEIDNLVPLRSGTGSGAT